MLAELRTRLGTELERLSRELEARMPVDHAADQNPSGDGDDDEARRSIQRRIRLLGQLTAGLTSLDPANLAAERAGYGSVVHVRDLERGDEETYTLMTGDLIDLDEGQVSLESPIGHALLGSREGEQVTVTTPRGERRYEVVSLSTLQEQLGVTTGPERDDSLPATGTLQVA